LINLIRLWAHEFDELRTAMCEFAICLTVAAKFVADIGSIGVIESQPTKLTVSQTPQAKGVTGPELTPEQAIISITRTQLIASCIVSFNSVLMFIGSFLSV
jgi:hypothetical protein